MDTHIKSASSATNERILAPVRFLNWSLYLMGLWPDKSTDRSDGTRKSVCTGLAYTLYTVVFQFVFTFAYDAFKCYNFLLITDFTIFTRAMFINITEISLAVKIVNLYVRLDTIHHCLNMVRSIKLYDADEEEVFRRKLSLLQKILIGWLITANMTGVFSYLSPMLVTGAALPYPGWYPLDWKNNSLDYWIVFMYQVLGMFFQIQALVIIEIYFIYLMVVVSAQLDILCDRIERIGYVDKEEATTEGEWDPHQNAIAERSMKECIRVHCEVLDLSNKIESTGSIPYFIQFLFSGIVLCVSVFQIGNMNIRGAIAEFGFYLGFVMTMLTQIFLPCYFGNEIQLKSERLFGSLYCSNWPGRSHRFRRLVMVYMEMLKRPRKLVIGSLFTLTLDSFLSVLNKAYSLYAVLQSFNE